MTLDGLLLERTSVSSRRFRAHSHDEFVISLNGPEVLRERVQLDRRRFDVGSDAVTVYNPAQVQSSVTETVGDAPWELLSLHVTPERVASILGGESAEFQVPVIENERLASGLRRAFGATGEVAQEWALWTVAEAFGRSTTRTEVDRRHSLLVDAAQRVMRRELCRPVRLEDLAAAVGVSADRLARAFVSETGFPPYAWHLQLRLLEGRRRLHRGAAISVVAAELGFADQSHFHRHYLASYARTPGQDSASRPQSPGSFKT